MNYDSKKINLISVPRDIFYKGRKLNNYYRIFGAEVFRQTISEVTGLAIDKYFVIDMYAFIDVINIIGGIEITLDNDLADPSYRVRDNGVWSTLYYKKGTHHLNGIETLRVARARHFLPVFSRDNRQLQILTAIKNKITSMSVNNFEKIYEIIKTVFSYLETDMSVIDSVFLLKNISEIKTMNQHIISTENVLFQTYSNLMYLGITEEEADDTINKGAWILLPLDNNWENISIHIDRIIRGSE